MKQLKLVLSAGLLGLALSAHAHFIWLSMDSGGTSATLELSDSPGKEVAPILYKMKDRMLLVGLDRLTDSADHKSMSASVVSSHRAVGVSALYGVFQGFLVHWSAKAANGVTEAEKPIGLTSEIVLMKGLPGLGKVFLKGKPGANADLEIYSPSSPTLTAKTGTDGSFTLPRHHGLVQIGAMIRRPGQGVYKGERYKEGFEACSLVVRLD